MTQLYGVIGDPISHSLSAVMQNRAFQATDLDAVYLPFHVPATELTAFVEAARRWPCAGFNITIPHKQAIRPLLDEIGADAEAIGAVNTVLNQEDRLIGRNTDAIGYIRSLKEDTGLDPAGLTVCILGAGGAAHAVVHGLLENDVGCIQLINRTEANAKQLQTHFAKRSQGRIRVHPWDQAKMREVFQESRLLINTTAIGLEGSRFEDLPLESLPDGSCVSDLVYRPRQTALLREAAARGLHTHEGLGMLLYQGAASFGLWTGCEPDIQVMRTALTEALAVTAT